MTRYILHHICYYYKQYTELCQTSKKTKMNRLFKNGLKLKNFSIPNIGCK